MQRISAFCKCVWPHCCGPWKCGWPSLTGLIPCSSSEFLLDDITGAIVLDVFTCTSVLCLEHPLLSLSPNSRPSSTAHMDIPFRNPPHVPHIIPSLTWCPFVILWKPLDPVCLLSSLYNSYWSCPSSNRSETNNEDSSQVQTIVSFHKPNYCSTAHGSKHSLIYVLSMATFCIIPDLNSCDRNDRSHKTKNVYYITIRKTTL